MIKRVPKFLIGVVFILLCQTVLAQNDSLKSKTPKKSIPNLEKVYLHTDRDFYTIGEDLWYKAYSVYAYTNVPFDYSKTLYVELVSPESKIITRNVTRLDGGLGHGDIKLTDSIGVKAGTYQLRAYTNWMRNFDEKFMFTKKIEVVDLNKDLTQGKDKSKKRQKTKPSINVQFFPEGGSLIKDVQSFVAFKAEDSNGNPIDLQGNIYDSNGDFITMFKTEHGGMGKFALTPEVSQNYFAEIKDVNGNSIKINLPEAQPEGYILNAVNRRGKHFFSIKTNHVTLNKSKKDGELVTLIASTRGITYFEGSQKITEVNTSFSLPMNDFPEGISQITLFDENSKPHSERLIYVDKKHGVNVSIHTDKEEYAPKEKVTLEVLAKDKTGNPIKASFSMASTDANIVGNETGNSSNICSYYLMESDIKGQVHNPGYYFNTSNKDRLYNLDLLLLTQGWRDFLWKKIPTKIEGKGFKLEKGIKISGKVKDVLLSGVKANSRVNMLLLKNEKFVRLTDTTDVNGRFAFEDLFFKGNSKMMINAKNEKGKSRGHIILDSLYKQPAGVSFDGYNISSFEKNKKEEIKSNIYKNNILFNVPIENMLDEVVISGKKKTDDRSMFGMADHTYTAADDGPNFSTIYQLIEFNVPGVNVSGNRVSFNRNKGGAALILLDGMEIQAEELDYIAPEDVAKIESIKTSRAAVLGSRGDNGAILIYTKEGKVNKTKNKNFHSITERINGYYNARVYYAPNYDKPETIEKDTPDVRNTLYWNPYIHPDENGTAKVSYFNSEVKTYVNITLEGITNDGIPIVVKGSYNVE